MRVMTGGNPYAHRQQRGKTNSTGFTNMFAKMSAHRSQESEKQANVDMWSLRRPRMDPHQDHGTQIKPDKEWLNTVGQPNAESKGDKELTESQIHFLQKHYDVENLTPEARHSLLCELTDIGVLSAADLSSDDQSKVDDVFEQIKAFKLGVATLVEFPEQPEAIISDYSDPEFRGMSDDEKFAAIMKKYDGGTHITSFKEVTMALHRNRLLTLEQSEVLWQLAMDDYVEKREKISPSAMPGHLTMEQVKFNYHVKVGDFLKQAHSLNPTWVQMERLSQLI